MQKLKQILFEEKKFYIIFFVAVILIGVIIRLKFFIFNPSLFKDEANVAIQLLERANFSDFFYPLRRNQVAPPMFLILSKFIYNCADKSLITPYISDMLLRVVPFTCGILMIPTFGYLVWKIFKNKLITLLGLCIVSFCPLLVTMSVYYKQYTMDALATILMLIITLHINIDKDSLKISILKFALLAITPFFSLTSLYVLPFIFLYLLFDAKQKSKLKRFVLCVSICFFIFLFYYFVFLHGIIIKHYDYMISFWNMETKHDNRIFLSLTLICILFSKNIKKIILYGGTTALTLFLLLLHQYPNKDRVLLFIIPIAIICCLFPIKYLIKINKIKYLISIIVFFTCIFFMLKPVESYRYREEYGRELWNTVYNDYKENKMSSPVIASKSNITNGYYGNMYNLKLIATKIVFNEEKWNELPPDLYFMVATVKKKSQKDKDYLQSRVGNDVQIVKEVDVNPYTYYIIFKKLK